MLCLQVTEAFGANRWDTAEFSNEGDKEKFIKLMVCKSRFLCCYVTFDRRLSQFSTVLGADCVCCVHAAGCEKGPHSAHCSNGTGSASFTDRARSPDKCVLASLCCSFPL